MVVGALVARFLLAIAFVVLMGAHQGNLPWLPAELVAFLCPFVGGYAATRLGQTVSMRLGALAGLAAGLVVLFLATIVSRLAPNTTLAGALLVMVGRADRGGVCPGRVFALVVLIVTACAPTAAGTVPPWQEL